MWYKFQRGNMIERGRTSELRRKACAHDSGERLTQSTASLWIFALFLGYLGLMMGLKLLSKVTTTYLCGKGVKTTRGGVESERTLCKHAHLRWCIFAVELAFFDVFSHGIQVFANVYHVSKRVCEFARECGCMRE